MGAAKIRIPHDGAGAAGGLVPCQAHCPILKDPDPEIAAGMAVLRALAIGGIRRHAAGAAHTACPLDELSAVCVVEIEGRGL